LPGVHWLKARNYAFSAVFTGNRRELIGYRSGSTVGVTTIASGDRHVLNYVRLRPRGLDG
jgi:hypothetical protein